MFALLSQIRGEKIAALIFASVWRYETSNKW